MKERLRATGPLFTHQRRRVLVALSAQRANSCKFGTTAFSSLTHVEDDTVNAAPISCTATSTS